MSHEDYIRSQMSTRRATLATTLCAVLLLAPFSGAPVAHAEGDDFARFCTQWMQKLAQRERDNLQQAQARPADTGVMLEYVGYGTEALRCEPRVPKPGRPGVGIMVYHELKYR